MPSLGSPRSASQSSLPRGNEGRTPTVLCGENGDHRLLLRGLLRLYRHPVVYEARTLDDLESLPSSLEPRILLFDVEDGDDDRWVAGLRLVLERHSELRAVVILPSGDSEGGSHARAAGARAVLPRPFAIQDLVRTLERAVA